VGLRRPIADAFTYVAELDGEFVGYCYVAAPTKDPDFGGDVAELAAMYIDPEHWREGIGHALMDTALARLAELPYAEAILWTFEENHPAISFYERHGWVKDGAERIHVRSGEPAIRMRRKLP
jgi:GNAT superfamily N-acetyltransferase